MGCAAAPAIPKKTPHSYQHPKRISELANGRIEKFTLDAMIDILDKLGFRTSLTLPSNDAGSPPQIVITQAPGS